MDRGEEPLGDDTLARLLRRRAIKVYAESIAFGILLTAVCLLLPF